MDNKEILKSMLNNLINNNTDEATSNLHNYLTQKMKDVASINVNAQSDFQQQHIENHEDVE